MEEQRPSPVNIPELVSHIVVDHLRDDTSTLKSCSLVSSIWSQVVQPTLLSCITIAPFVPGRGIHHFLSLLRQDLRMREFVAELAILPAGRSANGPRNPVLPYLAGIVSLEALLETLSLLPRIHTLHIDDVMLTASSLWFQVPSRAPEPPTCRLKLLCLRCTKLQQVHLLPGLLGMFSSIETLSMQELHPEQARLFRERVGRDRMFSSVETLPPPEVPPEYLNFPRHLPPVTHLNLRILPHASEIVSPLIRSITADKMTTLSIRDISVSREDSDTYRSLIKAAANIRSLEFWVDEPWRESSVLDTLDDHLRASSASHDLPSILASAGHAQPTDGLPPNTRHRCPL